MASQYKETLRKAENKESIQAAQKEWLANRNKCKDIECLSEVYMDRIAELRNPSYTLSIPKRPANEPSTTPQSNSNKAENDENQKAKEFAEGMGATWVDSEEFEANPYRYKGTTITFETLYKEMLDENTGLFILPQSGPPNLGNRVYPIVVSGLDSKHTLRSLVVVLLVGQVIGSKVVPGFQGNAPVLSFMGLYCPHIEDNKNRCGDVYTLKR
jgi:hypothetical protein